MRTTINLAGYMPISMDNTVVAEHYETVVCFSHLRWDFVYQRPQHLMSRFAKQSKVYYIEEPVFDSATAEFHVSEKTEGLFVVVPHLPSDIGSVSAIPVLKQLLDGFIKKINIHKTLFWYYTPMALQFSSHLSPITIVFDCMDELSAFQFAPPELLELETMLLLKADIVFTGGISLYQHKKTRHHNIHLFPSSIDQEHFRTARNKIADPEDQLAIPHPRLGFAGVIDERFDISLIETVADRHPEWHFVLLGPVVKIDPATLPIKDNIHYLGAKSYEHLPAYFSSWDIGLIPFADNTSTRFISPTKTPEYLSAGLPVISTPIKDVVQTYGINGMVSIATNADEFEEYARSILQRPRKRERLTVTDRFLGKNSWDNTYYNMQSLIATTIINRSPVMTKALRTIQA
jgi:UDP-galactopyranose mutase